MHFTRLEVGAVFTEVYIRTYAQMRLRTGRRVDCADRPNRQQRRFPVFYPDVVIKRVPALAKNNVATLLKHRSDQAKALTLRNVSHAMDEKEAGSQTREERKAVGALVSSYVIRRRVTAVYISCVHLFFGRSTRTGFVVHCRGARQETGC